MRFSPRSGTTKPGDVPHLNRIAEPDAVAYAIHRLA